MVTAMIGQFQTALVFVIILPQRHEVWGLCALRLTLVCILTFLCLSLKDVREDEYVLTVGSAVRPSGLQGPKTNPHLSYSWN